MVGIRKRPLSKKETSKGESDILTVKNQSTVIVSEYKYIDFEIGRKSILPSILKKPSSIMILPLMTIPIIRKYALFKIDLWSSCQTVSWIRF